MNVEVCLVVDGQSGLFQARTGRRHPQRITGLRVHAHHVRTLGNLASGEAHQDAILSGYRRHVDAVVRHVAIVVEDYLALRNATHRHTCYTRHFTLARQTTDT